MDLLQQNVQEYWPSLPENIRSILGWPDIDLQKIWVCFNIQNTSDIHFPRRAGKVVITYHTEYLKFDDLLEFFSRHEDTQFLFLTDWEQNSAGLPWPENVTCVQWLTWHHQIDEIISKYGINNNVLRPDHKISSLSFRHEFHKASVTAYLLKTFPDQDMILSWWNVRSGGKPYYLDPDFFLPPALGTFVLDENFQNIQTIELDRFVNKPINNSAWAHPAYLHCLFNCSNESVYNDFCMIDNRVYKLPWPYLTEKTWKPLLAGRAFIPVGQSGTLGSLSKLGLEFIPQMMDVDKIPNEFDRMLAVYDAINFINDGNMQELFDLTWPSICHNLHWISQGHFSRQCNLSNDLAKHKIQDWIKA